MDSKGYVYLLCDLDRERTYKIGVTRGDINKRIKKLQTGNAGEIHLVNYHKSEKPFFIEKCMNLLSLFINDEIKLKPSNG